MHPLLSKMPSVRSHLHAIAAKMITKKELFAKSGIRGPPQFSNKQKSGRAQGDERKGTSRAFLQIFAASRLLLENRAFGPQEPAENRRLAFVALIFSTSFSLAPGGSLAVPLCTCTIETRSRCRMFPLPVNGQIAL